MDSLFVCLDQPLSGLKGETGRGTLNSQLTSSQNASREDADEDETESFFWMTDGRTKINKHHTFSLIFVVVVEPVPQTPIFTYITLRDKEKSIKVTKLPSLD